MPRSLACVVPVAPAEPLDVIEHSVAALTGLEAPDDAEVTCLYVVDTDDADSDDRVAYLEEVEDRVDVLPREHSRGRRAGAINDGIDHLPPQDYIALFDVDSRPPRDILPRALPVVAQDGVFLVSGSRNIVNSDTNRVTEMVDTEFQFITDMQALLTRQDGFCHFNGLIGVLDGSYLQEHRLCEDVICEDIEFTNRAYQDGKEARMVPGVAIGEQAPATLDDLTSQTTRWITGAIESLARHRSMLSADPVPPRVRLSWLLSMVTPFFAALLSPLALLYSMRLPGGVRERGRRAGELFAFTWLVSYAGLVALTTRLRGSSITWTTPGREDR